MNNQRAEDEKKMMNGRQKQEKVNVGSFTKGVEKKGEDAGRRNKWWNKKALIREKVEKMKKDGNERKSDKEKRWLNVWRRSEIRE